MRITELANVVVFALAVCTSANASDSTNAIQDPARKKEILDRILARPVPENIRLRYTLTQEADAQPTKSADYLLFMDAERYYLEGHAFFMTDDERLDPARNDRTIVKSWNGTGFRSLDAYSESGKIEAENQASTFTVLAQGILGFMTYEQPLEVVLTPEHLDSMEFRLHDGNVTVTRAMTDFLDFAYTFDTTRDYAIVQLTMSAKDLETGERYTTKNIIYADFRNVAGYHIPFRAENRISDRALGPLAGKNAIAGLIASEAQVNLEAINERLRGFEFPDGTGVWDEILNQGIVVGRELDKIEEALVEDIEKVSQVAKAEPVVAVSGRQSANEASDEQWLLNSSLITSVAIALIVCGLLVVIVSQVRSRRRA